MTMNLIDKFSKTLKKKSMNNFFVINNTYINLFRLYSKISNISIITHI